MSRTRSSIPTRGTRSSRLRRDSTSVPGQDPLAVLPRVEEFTDQGQLIEALRHQEKTTHLFRISKQSDALLDEQGRLQGKYTLTEHALNQLCSRLSMNLNLVIFHLSGIHKVNDPDLDARHSYSVEMCARWLNDLVKLRFDMLARYSWVLDRETKTVEGLVGRSHAFVSNMSLLDDTRTVLERNGFKLALQDAILHGRHMTLCWRDTKRFVDIPSPSGQPDRFNAGFHFVNSEVGGSPMTASAAVIRRMNNTRAISPFTDCGRLPYLSGAKFQDRFNTLLEKVIVKSKEDFNLKEQLARIRESRIGIGGDEQQHQKAMDRMRSKFRARCQAAYVNSVLSRTAWRGAYKETKIKHGPQCFKHMAGRTAFDLYSSLTYAARSLHPAAREPGEQLAYEILAGTYKLIGEK